MPILTVLLAESAPDLMPSSPAAAFAAAAAIEQELVTVSVLPGVRQSGNAYRAVVHIVLPDSWDTDGRGRLLAAAQAMLRECFGIAPADSIITLLRIGSGDVADRGTIERW